MTRVRTRLVVMAAIGSLAAFGAVLAVEADPEETYRSANEAYRDGRFADAAEGYRSLLASGYRDPRVEFNLGNAAYKLGRLGEAILHYERARRLAPSDEEILHNLEVARERTVDRIAPSDDGGVLAAVRSLQDGAGPDRQIGLAAILLWIVAGLVTWCSVRSRGWPAWAGWVLAAVVIALAVVVASWWATWSRLEGTPRAIALDPAIEVLAGPGGNNAVLFTIHEGTAMEIRDEREGWLQVSLPNGLNGWVPRDAAGVI